MSKKRRKRHELGRPTLQNKIEPKSLSTMADRLPPDLLKRVRQEFGKREVGSPDLKNSQSVPVRTQPKHQRDPSTGTTNTKSSHHSRPASTPRQSVSKTVRSSAGQIAKSQHSQKEESLGLAEVAAKTVRTPSRSLRRKRRLLDGPTDWRSTLNSAETKERQTKYRQIILDSLARAIRNALDINLGIDLGTSFSKVVWRGEEKAYPICFGDNPASLDDYLVQSIVAYDGQSIKTSLTSDANIPSQICIPNFKMCLACESDNSHGCRPADCALSNWSRAINSLPDPVALVNAVFLATLISRSRFLVRQHLKKLGVRDGAIRWSANLAVPEKYMDESPTLQSFGRVLRIAWLMAELLDQGLDINKADEVIDLYEAAKQVATDHQKLDCFVYPEVAAEVAAVTKPRSAKQGLYAFVDVGAGTVDGSVFRFYRPHQEDPRQVTYAANVIRAGAAHVEFDACEKLAEVARAWFKTMKEDGANAAGLSLTPESILSPPFDATLKELETEVRDELIQLFKSAHEKEIGESNWKNLQLIIGGGGASLATYANAAIDAFTLKGSHRGDNLTKVLLEAPPDFQMGRLSRNTFHRFAVAYGLSFSYVNLPDVVLAREVDSAGSGRVRGPITDPTNDG